MAYWQKQNSSRPIVYQFLTYGGNATSVPSTAFSAQTVQIRVCSEVQGWLQIDGSTVAATVTSSSMKIPPNFPEYFTVNPGAYCAFNSTSTATGVCSVVEMC
jgi:hypothetical protein